jgi:Zn-dependent peptidase ImmA (M78 family)
MQIITKEYIEEVSEIIHKEFKIENQIQIDPVTIAEKFGFTVFKSTFDSDNISGMVINSNEEKSIYINENDSINRQRFTVAHELGHIILHHEANEKSYKEVDFRTNSGFDVRESQANSLAAALLMPRKKANEIWSKLKDVDDFADAFKVSKQAASIRLDNLGLI